MCSKNTLIFLISSIFIFIILIQLTNAEPVTKFEEVLNHITPSASGETIRRYMPHIDELERVVFYIGFFSIIFGLIFFLLVCFGCGYIDCGINLRGRTTYDEI
ncbi:hypothetical protein PVAND_014506 [Polypedilum vanderplanki]|uniref:Uncharacterized protein n=1 Tax=Polypedilum vanderplanki TaxID=319348 RepID=A0A9J6B9Y8_POLVA|nr:hypothetical protein PVAND_014506 [Polypedilum vanderplanki]